MSSWQLMLDKPLRTRDWDALLSSTMKAARIVGSIVENHKASTLASEMFDLEAQARTKRDIIDELKGDFLVFCITPMPESKFHIYASARPTC